MGRRRTKDLDLPPRMRRRGQAYYYDHGGKPRRWEPLGADKPKALRQWAELEGKHDQDRTVAAAIDRYLTLFVPALSKNTRIAYEHAGKTLKKYFGTAMMDQVKVEHLATYRDLNPKKAAINVQLMFLGMVYQRAKEWGWCATNPAAETRRNVLKERDRYLTDEEYATLWDASRPLVRVVMDLCYLTAMRQSDALKIRLADLRDDGIHVRQQKTGKRQVFLWTDELRGVIEAAKALPKPIGSMFLLCRRDGSPYTQRLFQKYWTTDWHKTAVENARMHDIRAKAATDTEGDAQLLLGHANKQMTARYIRLRKSDIVEVLQKTPRK